MDATRQPSFTRDFGISLTELPRAVVYSPKKQAFIPVNGAGQHQRHQATSSARGVHMHQCIWCAQGPVHMGLPQAVNCSSQLCTGNSAYGATTSSQL